MDIRVIESAYDLKDCIDRADVREELVPKSLTFTRSFDEASDIDKFDMCRDDLCAVYDHSDFFESIIVHIYDTGIWFDRTEWEVRRFSSIGFCESIKKRRFTDVWKSYDSDLHEEMVKKMK